MSFPALPANMQALAFFVRVPPTGTDYYTFDGRNETDVSGARGYLVTNDASVVTYYVDGVVSSGTKPGLSIYNGAWRKIIIVSTSLSLSTIFARYTKDQAIQMGDIAQIRLYNRALTAAELADPTSDFPPDAVGVYDPFQSTATQLADTSGNGYNLTIAGPAPVPMQMP